MTKILCYLYLGDNGSVLTPVKLEGAYGVKRYRIHADSGSKITKDGINFYDAIVVSESEANDWYEVSDKGQV